VRDRDFPVYELAYWLLHASWLSASTQTHETDRQTDHATSVAIARLVTALTTDDRERIVTFQFPPIQCNQCSRKRVQQLKKT